jgi:predicted YcjX-like family ATPase
MESTTKQLNNGLLTRLYWLKSTKAVVSAGVALDYESTEISKTTGGIYIGVIVNNKTDEILAIAQMSYQQYSDCFDDASEFNHGDAQRWHAIASHVYKCSPDYVFVAEKSTNDDEYDEWNGRSGWLKLSSRG